MKQSTSPSNTALARVAYTPAEFASAFGRDRTWAYRKIYKGDVDVIAGAGRLLIPATEADKILATAAPYNPPGKKKKSKMEAASNAPSH